MKLARRRLILMEESKIKWLYRDEFITDRATGAINNTAAEPGVATRSVTDTQGKLSIFGEKLLCSGGNSTFGDPAIWWSYAGGALARARGRMLIWPEASSTIRLGLSRTASGGVADLRFYTDSTFRITDNGDLGDITITSPTSVSKYFVIMRAVGGLIGYRNTSGQNILLWPGNQSNNANNYPAVTTFNAAFNFEDVRVVDLKGKWVQDTGAALFYTSVSAANATATMQPNGIIEFRWTAATNAVLEIDIRRTDDDNRWIIRCDQAGGTIKIIERNTGTETERGSASQIFTNGNNYRIVVIANTVLIETYVAITRKATYASATFNQSATGVKVNLAGANFGVWPRLLNLPASVFAPTPIPVGNEYMAEIARFKANATSAQNVVYLGGSITNGSSASNAATESFRALVGAYLDANYPSATLTHYNAGVGGTRSWYGLVRLATDVIAHNPTLVFIDFCANDGALAVDHPSSEALVRRLRTSLPDATLISCFFGNLTTTALADDNTGNTTDYVLRWWRRICAEYGVVFVNYISQLATLVASGGHVATYQADSVHPNTAGHAVAASLLEGRFSETVAGTPVDWSLALSGYTYLDANTSYYENTPIIRNGTDNDGETGAGWSTSGASRVSSTANATIKWTGVFQSFGLDTITSGSVQYDIDGGGYGATDDLPNRITNQPLWSGSRGSHTVTVKIISGTVTINRFLAI